MPPSRVVGIFRAIHTFKGMAATMGYAQPHRAGPSGREPARRAARAIPAPPRTSCIDLLLRIVDALEAGVDEAAAGADAGFDAGELPPRSRPPLPRRTGDRRAEAPAGASPEPRDRGAAAAVAATAPLPVTSPSSVRQAGRVVRVAIRPDGAAARGPRAARAPQGGERSARSGVGPAGPAAFEQEDFDGRFAFRLEAPGSERRSSQAILAAGDVDASRSSRHDADRRAAVPTAAAPRRHAGRSATRQIRVDLRRLDALMNQVGELVVAKGRLAGAGGRAAEPRARGGRRADRPAGRRTCRPRSSRRG